MTDVVRELTVQISANGASTAEKDIKGLQNAVLQADAKFKSAGAGIKGFEKTTAGMQARVTMLSDKLKAQQGIVERANATYEKAKARMTTAANEQQKYAQKVDAARAAIAAEIAISGKDSEASKALAEALKQAEGQHAALAKSAQSAAQQVQRNEIALEKAKAEVKGTEIELRAANATLQKHGSVWAQAGQKIAAAGANVGEWGKKTSTVGRNITAGITVPVAAASVAAFKAWENMDDGLDTVIRKTGATGAALVPLEKAYSNVFLGMKVSAEDTGIAIGEVSTRFKVTGTQLENLSKTFIQFADVNSTDLNGSIGATAKILAQWKEPTSAAAGFLGLLTSESKRAGIGVDQLMNSVQANGATIKAMGLDLSQAVQMMANFEAAGINADTALAALKKSAANYAKDGLPLEQGLAMTVKAIQSAKDETAALAIAQKAFGAKGALEMSTAIREGRFSVTGLTADMRKMGDVVGKTFAEINGDTANIDRLKNKIISAGAAIGKSQILPWAEKAAEKFASVVDGLSKLDPAMQQTILDGVALAATTGPIVSGIGKIATGASALMTLFSGPVGWVTLGIATVAGLGIALSSIKSNIDVLDEKMRSVKLKVDASDVSQITADIEAGIQAAQTEHTVKVSVDADTASIQTKLDTVFADGKFTKKEYNQASKYVASVVAPDLQAAIDTVNEKTKALKASLDGAVNAEGQPLSEAEKTALIDQITAKTTSLVTDLQAAQTNYESLIKEIYNQRKPATDAQIAALDALLEKIATIRAEIKLAGDEARNMARADYNKVIAGQGTTENYGGAIGYVQGQQTGALDDARKKLDAVKATAGAMTDTAAANDLLTAAERDYAAAVSQANAEAQIGYQAILDGAAKASGAGTLIATLTQDYNALAAAMKLLGDQKGMDSFSGYVDLLKQGGALAPYLSAADSQLVAPYLDPNNKNAKLGFADVKGVVERIAAQITDAFNANKDDPKLNVLNELVQGMLNSGTLDGIDITKADGALAGVFAALDFTARGKEIGQQAVKGIDAGIGIGAAGVSTAETDKVRNAYLEAFKTSFDSHSPARVMEPVGQNITAGIAVGVMAGIPGAVSSVNAVYTAMIEEANRMRPQLQAAMSAINNSTSGNGGYYQGNTQDSYNTMPRGMGYNYTTSANQYIENYNVNAATDAQALAAEQAALAKRLRRGYGSR